MGPQGSPQQPSQDPLFPTWGEAAGAVVREGSADTSRNLSACVCIWVISGPSANVAWTPRVSWWEGRSEALSQLSAQHVDLVTAALEGPCSPDSAPPLPESPMPLPVLAAPSTFPHAGSMELRGILWLLPALSHMAVPRNPTECCGCSQHLPTHTLVPRNPAEYSGCSQHLLRHTLVPQNPAEYSGCSQHLPTLWFHRTPRNALTAPSTFPHSGSTEPLECSGCSQQLPRRWFNSTSWNVHDNISLFLSSTASV